MSTKQIIYLVFVVSLIATVTNFISISVSFSMLILLLPLLLKRLFNRPVPKFYFFLLMVYAYFLVSTLIYSPSVLLVPEFYRRDGNFFVTYIPIVILGLIQLNIKLDGLIQKFVIWASFFSLMAYIILPPEAPHLHHLAFISHNAAGGFIAMVLALSLGLYLEKRQPFFLLVSLLDFFLLWETGSRGTILAFLITFVQVIVLKERFTKLMIIGATITMLVILSFVYPLWIQSGGQYSESYILSHLPFNVTRAGTFLVRGLSLWPRAWDNFLKSPVWGQGFGSYDDVPYHFEDFGFAILNTGKNYIHSAAHAHNSYLNFLSETGLIGFLLVFLFLYSLHNFIKRKLPAIGLNNLGLLLAFWVAVWSSFTEHRLTTPSQMLPFTILIGLGLSTFRGYQAQTENIHLAGKDKEPAAIVAKG